MNTQNINIKDLNLYKQNIKYLIKRNSTIVTKEEYNTIIDFYNFLSQHKNEIIRNRKNKNIFAKTEQLFLRAKVFDLSNAPIEYADFSNAPIEYADFSNVDVESLNKKIKTIKICCKE